MKRYNSYKDSGIEWIGEIPEHWEVSRIGYNSTLTVPQRDKPTDLTGPIPWLRIEDFEGKHVFESKSNQGVTQETVEKMNLKVYPIGTVLTACSCTMGKTAIVQKPLITNQTFIGITPCNSLDSNFLFYFISNASEYLDSISSGAIQSYLSRDEFSKIKIPLPSLQEQTAIANYLDRKTTQIDDLIAKKEQFIRLLEEEKVAVINQAVTKGLDPTVAMKDSGVEWLGEIPEHWEVKKLKLIANIQGRIGFKGYTISDLVSEGEGALTLGAKHIDKNNKLNLSNPEYISWDKYYESPEIMVKIGDIILTQRGTLGKVILITEDIGKATINPSMVILSQLKANSQYLYYFFNSDYFKSWIDLSNTSTAVPMISQGQLGNLKIVLPNIDDQINIVEFIKYSMEKINTLITKTQEEIDLLKEYKTALISEVVTGKVDVRSE